MSSRVFAAVDIGASGGRVMAGIVDDDGVRLQEVHRFANGARQRDGHLRWDITTLYGEVLDGLGRLARAHPAVESVGIDTWGVDYALLDDAGNLLADPVAYRDDRTAAVIADVHTLIAPADLYTATGIQFLPFNTIYQLAAEQREEHWDDIATIALIPDLLAYWLTGELATEATIASTTGLVDVRTGDWSPELLDRLAIPADLLPPIVAPGSIRGTVRPEICARVGFEPGTVVTTVGSHDTASAVVAVPASEQPFAYVASGTWSLVGLELEQPVVTSAARTANFTNEAGVDGRTRFLRNVGGLWLLQESLRHWAQTGLQVDLSDLIAAAARAAAGGPTVSVDDDVFIAPGNMPQRIAERAGDEDLAHDPPRLARCVVESLADTYAATVTQAAHLADRPVEVIHIVGGGSLNGLLCQLTADRSGLPVTAGPTEATALGNVLVQARAHGAAPSSIEGLRDLVTSGADVTWYAPDALAEVHP